MTFVRNEREKDAVSTAQWYIAIYLRLSKEDGDKMESDSIQNQRGIIEQHIKYLQNQGEMVACVETYSDDGYPGGNFERPEYKRMIRDIEAGKINCVIFKDNSRLGRNYPELGRLMEEYFPQKGIRVISVLNHIDSLKDPHGYCSAIVSFSNIMNDDYIRQLSIKIKSTFAMKRERGEFLGNYAPYGYIKSPEDKHKLVIDDEAAEVVRMIFNWYADGVSANGIVKQLNALQIVPPSVYKTMKGCKGFANHSSGGIKRNIWSVTSVNTMLNDEVYIGNLVQGKCKSASYRTKKVVQADESEWTVVEGTHEAIISDELFTVVHERFARRTRVAPKQQNSYMLSGLVKCARCGSRMNRNVSNGQPRFRCMTRVYAPEKCQCPSVRESVLEQAILSTIQRQIQELVDAKAVIDAARRESTGGRSQNEYKIALDLAAKEKERLSDAKFRLYDSLERGLIDRDEYIHFKARYNAGITEQDEQIRRLRENLEQIREARKQDDEFIAFFKEFGTINSLDRDVLNRLVDHIEVTDAQHIDIYFKFSAERKKLLDFAKDIEEQAHSNNVC
ncbi:MAG: recombinase family protein [Butyricicoccus sp.]|nr:recombinase family protein [Butyricicoccus sp.]